MKRNGPFRFDRPRIVSSYRVFRGRIEELSIPAYVELDERGVLRERWSTGRRRPEWGLLPV